MNNKLISSAKKINAIFLAIVLVAGTITALSSQSSFIVGAQAQPYYGIDNNYEKSYGKENYKSTKDSNIDLNKIKCKNINLNINNGQDGNGDSINGNETNNGNKKFHKDDFAFVCINNNNNIVTGNGGNATDGDGNVPDGDGTDTVRTTLSVSKTIGDCTPTDTSQNAIDACVEIGTEILPNLYTLSVIDNTLIPTFVEGSSVPVVVTLNPGDYQAIEIDTPSLMTAFDNIRNMYLVDITSVITVTGDCDLSFGGGAGTIAEGDSQTCNIVNSFEVREMI